VVPNLQNTQVLFDTMIQKRSKMALFPISDHINMDLLLSHRCMPGFQALGISKSATHTPEASAAPSSLPRKQKAPYSQLKGCQGWGSTTAPADPKSALGGNGNKATFIIKMVGI
jgi:hypothetical protein